MLFMQKIEMEAESLSNGTRLRAFSLVEIITVIAIILVVMAITLPIISSAKKAGFESSSRQSLHQNWLALELYRQDWGGGMDYGNAQQMALPLDSSDFRFPEVPPYRNPRTRSTGFTYYPREDGVSSSELVDEWIRYSKRCWAESIVLADFNFNDFDPWTSKPFSPKKALGVVLGGSIITRIREGMPNIPFWWECKNGS